jgi:hypothetical protein
MHTHIHHDTPERAALVAMATWNPSFSRPWLIMYLPRSGT